MKTKKYWILLVAIIIVTFTILIKLNTFSSADILFKKLPIKAQVLLRFIKKNNKYGNNFSHIFNNFFNDYNVKFIPETQFIDVDFKKININFKSDFKKTYQSRTDSVKNFFYTFFIEIINDDILITDYVGNFYIIHYSDLQSNKKTINPKVIKSNFSPYKTLDTFFYKNKIFVSYSNRNKNCYNFNIDYAAFNLKKLNFNNFYHSTECSIQNYYQPHGGKMQYYSNNQEDGLLFTIGDNNDIPKPSDSIVGKILFIDFQNKNEMFFSKGHRNTQGLFSDGEIVLSTEHGPRGGDEINKILYNSDYGWPFVSYGEPYGSKIYHSLNKFHDKPKYLKNHSVHNFSEPIFSFAKSIGISEIIKLPNNFSNFWKNNFLLSSLWEQSLFRIQFGDNYKKIMFYEKIFIGQRIRDIKYHNELNAIILALEEKGELGIITEKKVDQ